jgi:hypothetical protein
VYGVNWSGRQDSNLRLPAPTAVSARQLAQPPAAAPDFIEGFCSLSIWGLPLMTTRCQPFVSRDGQPQTSEPAASGRSSTSASAGRSTGALRLQVVDHRPCPNEEAVDHRTVTGYPAVTRQRTRQRSTTDTLERADELQGDPLVPCCAEPA